MCSSSLRASSKRAAGHSFWREMRVTMWKAKVVGKHSMVDDIEMKQHETAPVHDA